MAFETYLIYLAAVAVFFATPPDTSQLLIISNSVCYGLRKSAYTIAGDLSANCLQMTGAAFGLAAIIATSATAFSVIKWLGVAYLIYIGIQLFRSRDDVNDVDANQSGQALGSIGRDLLPLWRTLSRLFSLAHCSRNLLILHLRSCRNY
jgi:homoserine/homoserine lactone efflux protein